MYDLLIDLIGISPYDNLPGFIFCSLILIWFIYQLFQLLYTMAGK